MNTNHSLKALQLFRISFVKKPISVFAVPVAFFPPVSPVV